LGCDFKNTKGVYSLTRRRELDESEVVGGELVVASCDPTALFDLIEEPVVPKNAIRSDSRAEAESGHHQMR
jgi:hypothetical protein